MIYISKKKIRHCGINWEFSNKKVRLQFFGSNDNWQVYGCAGYDKETRSFWGWRSVRRKYPESYARRLALGITDMSFVSKFGIESSCDIRNFREHRERMSQISFERGTQLRGIQRRGTLGWLCAEFVLSHSMPLKTMGISFGDRELL